MFNHSFKTGLCFGLTSGIITTLGLMVGLHSGTHSRMAVIGGILTVAIADAFSDALGIHLSEESEEKHTQKEIWQTTILTFLAKFFVALTFILPALWLPLSEAIITNVIYGLFLLSLLSFFIAKERKVKPWKVISEHLLIAATVIIIAHYLGDWIALRFE